VDPDRAGLLSVEQELHTQPSQKWRPIATTGYKLQRAAEDLPPKEKDRRDRALIENRSSVVSPLASEIEEQIGADDRSTHDDYRFEHAVHPPLPVILNVCFLISSIGQALRQVGVEGIDDLPTA